MLFFISAITFTLFEVVIKNRPITAVIGRWPSDGARDLDASGVGPRDDRAFRGPGLPSAGMLVEKEVIKEVPVEAQIRVDQIGVEQLNVPGASATVSKESFNPTFLEDHDVNTFVETEADPLSTFPMDMDTASYTVTRRFVQEGVLPDPASVHVEEFMNYFEQGYGLPRRDAFAIHVEGSTSPFGGENHWLMRVGLQGRAVDLEQRRDATLIFVIDVSGSMAHEDRLALVKNSLENFVDELRPADEVGIVLYGNRGQVVLEPTSGTNKELIVSAVRSLSPGGSSYLEDGLRLAYQMAGEQIRETRPGRMVRVVLLSDGVGNVGRDSADSILRQVRDNVDEGVTLTTVGFGMGSYNDVLMEQLANDGDGSHYYIDSLPEARHVFSESLVGTLQVIARDANVQVDFNPDVVSRYRLLGYEDRRIEDGDFRNDALDAVEVGAGHSVTALYELKLHDDADGALATVAVRYEDPDSGDVSELTRELKRGDLTDDFKEASPRFQLAAVVAEYAELLRGSYWAQGGSLSAVVPEAKRVRDMLAGDVRVAEFADLAARTEKLWVTMSQ